ncbi:hypothetical protein ES332_A02G206000v1 [Gossypium tomentosum]|uniref:Calmodulin-lysine N-methyltransferase n=1 Tax=Gossypium tomentosum TaxID=34277 RepID=A0A5D2RKL2_GOSTO|nr:hypothetical protein ES332_A02G206000v1 [Gossypium tomentosum]
METNSNSASSKPSASSLRWRILSRAVLHRAKNPEDESQLGMKLISRKAAKGFNLIPCQLLNHDPESRDAQFCYTLPTQGCPKLVLTQRLNNNADLTDFEICNRHNIDNTGIVCQWPSEDVLAYYCLSHADMFRSKRVIELGSGYGLAGLTIAATTEALEVVISDGNPQVVDYILHNINTNSGAFGETRVKPMKLHWNEKEVSNLSHTFDVIVASDCVVDDVSSQSIETTYSPLTRGKKSLCYELKAKRLGSFGREQTSHEPILVTSILRLKET